MGPKLASGGPCSGLWCLLCCPALPWAAVWGRCAALGLPALTGWQPVWTLWRPEGAPEVPLWFSALDELSSLEGRQTMRLAPLLGRVGGGGGHTAGQPQV